MELGSPSARRRQPSPETRSVPRASGLYTLAVKPTKTAQAGTLRLKSPEAPKFAPFSCVTYNR